MIVWMKDVWLIFVARVVLLVHESRLTVVKFCEWYFTVVVMNELSVCLLTVCEGSNTVQSVLYFALS